MEQTTLEAKGRAPRRQNIGAALAAVINGVALSTRVARAVETIAVSLERDGDPAGAALVREAAEPKRLSHGFNLGSEKKKILDWPNPVDETLVLDAVAQTRFDRVTRELAAASRFVAAGIDPPTRLLFVGPTGTGKTLAARTIARDLGLPIAIARLDVVVESHMGESAKRMRDVFEAAVETPCVLLLDEIDGMTERRGRVEGSASTAESERTTLALFQQLDGLPLGQIVIAATNMADRLDPALVRRFPERLDFAEPNEVSRERMIRGWLARVAVDDEAIRTLVRETESAGGADIRARAMAIGREHILREVG